MPTHALNTETGTLSSLTTTAKGSLVAAVNEIRATVGHDPLLLSSSLFAHRKMWMNASPQDTIVAKTANADALFSKLNGVADITYLTASGEHGDPSHFPVSTIINFLNS